MNANKTRITYDKTTGNILDVKPPSEYERPNLEDIITEDFPSEYWDIIMTGTPHRIDTESKTLVEVV